MHHVLHYALPGSWLVLIARVNSMMAGHLTLRHYCRCETDFVVDDVCRLSGPALFRHALLAKHGPLVMLPEDKLRLSREELAAYLQEQIEAVTGRSLLEYRKTAY